MNSSDDMLSIETAKILLRIIKPGDNLKAITPKAGGYSNLTHLIEVSEPDGTVSKVVVRRYSKGERDRGEKARREYTTLKFVREHGIPSPEPLYLDETGAVLGIPGIVTSHIEGETDLTPSNPDERARVIAEVLVNLHSLPCNIPEESHILDANSEASWFLCDEKAPEIMKNDPFGLDVLKAAREIYPKIESVKPSLVHTDIWPGNIIWQDNRISGIVDWDDAGYGDPAIDIGYCRMELSIAGYFSAADTLLSEYEKLIGKRLDNLLFWELVASVKPIYKPEIWDVVNEPRRWRFEKFILNLLKIHHDKR